MKVKLSILRIPQAVFLSERKQILIGKEIIRVVGIIVTETTLVTRYKILVIRDTAREPGSCFNASGLLKMVSVELSPTPAVLKPALPHS